MRDLASRMADLGTETAFDVLARARSLEAHGRRVLHLEIGEPDFPTPPHIVEAGVRALRDGHTRYGPPPGLPALREAICERLLAERGVRASPDEVVVTPGAKPILFLAILATVGKGDEVLVPDPGFPIYESVVRFAGARVVPVPVREESAFSLDVDAAERLVTPRTRMLIFNSPANPTGGATTPRDLERIAALAERHDLWVIADEIYARISYEEPHRSIAALPGMRDRVILSDGFSKAYAMTGWRLGYGVVPRRLVEPLTRLVINSNSCTAAFVQLAGVEALRGTQEPVERMVAEFRRRRDLVVSALRSIPGVRCAMPHGAFYAFPDVSSLPLSASELASRLLEEHAVATLSGTAFGPGGDGHLRISYVSAPDVLSEALERIRSAVASS
ncbi:MAG TPA: pyridoxal phosphate-dependent aminotransferase [Myxococcales bacterium]|jgi:aspartate/methionine/tyrosine aminotransferase|nr:pyridoxal phosphate-dependent aminotransferase [Myxococcales bacterium]